MFGMVLSLINCKRISKMNAHSAIRPILKTCWNMGGFFDDVSQEDKDMLSDMLTATFVCWAKQRGIEYGVDIPVMLLGLYNLQTGKPVEEESK